MSIVDRTTTRSDTVNAFCSSDATRQGYLSGITDLGFDLRFPGLYPDKETGLFYNYFRDYDPQTGRYAGYR